MANEISLDIQQKVADIAAKTRDKTKIDSKAEMEALGQLLNGDYSEADKRYIEQKIEEGRQNVYQRNDEQINKDKVSKFIKNIVLKIASISGDKKKVDTIEEQKMMKSYLDDEGNGLSETEKEYIENEMFKGSDEIPKMPHIVKPKVDNDKSFGV